VDVSFQGFHVLAVDDDDASLRLMIKVLGDLGVSRVVPARSGSEALTILLSTARPFDCILCDLKMPNGNGLQLLKAIRCGEVKGTRPDACFIFLTALNDAPTVRTAGQLDTNGYLVKPLTIERLKMAIAKGKTKAFAIDFGRYSVIPVPQTA
jgi:two-component system chemotaxis response regulator CheY